MGSNEVKYTGFFTRLLVFIVDIFVVSFLIYFIAMLVNIDKNPIVILLIWWLYTAIMLNRWRTTIGGKILGTRILDSNLSKPSFLKASIRFFVSIAPFILYTYLRGLQHTMTLPPSPTVQMLPQLIFILLPFIMFFSKKKQMIHDMLVKSIVVDVNSKPQKDDTMGERIVAIGQKVLRVIGSVLFLIVFGYVAIYTFVFYTLGKQSTNNHNASFHTEYHPKDYNNSKIIFYQKELEEASKNFIEADEMYEIFEADVKKDLALGCIRYFIKREGSENWLDEGVTHRLGARNKYATTEEKIKKAKRNSNYMGKHFYTFDLNMVNHIVDDITKTWSDKNESVCEQTLATEDMYKMFISKYIPKFENENIYSRFGNKPQQREVYWHNLLMKSYPKYLKIKKEEEKILNDKYQKIKQDKKDKKRRKEEKLYLDKVKESKYPIFAAILFHKNDDFDNLLIPGNDLEIKDKHGYTLLFVAMIANNEYAIKRLLQSGANMYAIGEDHDYSPLTWAAKDNDIKTIKHFIKNGVNVNFQHKKSETALTVAAKGCENFELVELLLDHGADPKIIDTYGKNTITGLSRYCRDKDKYKKMIKLIKNRN